ncbi:MAG TPA: flagellar hook-basal body complex protein FliE [Actinoplanes sp.]|jgi:flagellar hook-basal body complex protein FliE
MTSPISAISGFSGISGVSGLSGVSDADSTNGLDSLTDTSGASGTSGASAVQGPNDDFAGLLSKGLENVQATQKKADDLAVQVADGTLQDPAQYTMAANEASLGLQLTLAVRNKALDAFQEIMRMQA